MWCQTLGMVSERATMNERATINERATMNERTVNDGRRSDESDQIAVANSFGHVHTTRVADSRAACAMVLTDTRISDLRLPTPSKHPPPDPPRALGLHLARALLALPPAPLALGAAQPVEQAPPLLVEGADARGLGVAKVGGVHEVEVRAAAVERPPRLVSSEEVGDVVRRRRRVPAVARHHKRLTAEEDEEDVGEEPLIAVAAHVVPRVCKPAAHAAEAEAAAAKPRHHERQRRLRRPARVPAGAHVEAARAQRADKIADELRLEEKKARKRLRQKERKQRERIAREEQQQQQQGGATGTDATAPPPVGGSSGVGDGAGSNPA